MIVATATHANETREERIRELKRQQVNSLRVTSVLILMTIALTGILLAQRFWIVQLVALIPATLGSLATYYRLKWLRFLKECLREAQND